MSVYHVTSSNCASWHIQSLIEQSQAGLLSPCGETVLKAEDIACTRFIIAQVEITPPFTWVLPCMTSRPTNNLDSNKDAPAMTLDAQLVATSSDSQAQQTQMPSFFQEPMEDESGKAEIDAAAIRLLQLKATYQAAPTPKNMIKSCVECHTTHTPQWRNGPTRNRELCNACGIAFYRNVVKANKWPHKG